MITLSQYSTSRVRTVLPVHRHLFISLHRTVKSQHKELKLAYEMWHDPTITGERRSYLELHVIQLSHKLRRTLCTALTLNFDISILKPDWVAPIRIRKIGEGDTDNPMLLPVWGIENPSSVRHVPTFVFLPLGISIDLCFPTEDETLVYQIIPDHLIKDESLCPTN